MASSPTACFVLALLLAGSARAQEAAPVPAGCDVDALLRRFEELSPAEQKRALAAAHAAIEAIDDPFLASVRAAIAHLERHAVLDRFPFKRPAGGPAPSSPAPAGSALPFPVHVAYVFGTEKVRRLAGADGARSDGAAAMRAMLLGHVPDLDAALASLCREMDRDRGADAFAKLLETWRHGEESFYRALDRTAGTDEALFFYDAMLGDFVRQCVPSNDPDRARLRASPDAAHAALHEAFLAYRQYRGLREATALALLLPPDVALPGSMARYEESGAGGYSMRDIVTLLLADADQDVGRVAAIVAASAPALPAGLWRGYDPFPAFHAAFRARVPHMVEGGGHTDDVLARQRARRTELQQRVANAACDALRGVLVGH